MLSRLSTSSWLARNRKLPLQCAYLAIVFMAIVLSGVRISQIRGRSPSRSDTIAIVMGVKSIVFMAYQLTTTYVAKLRRWRSLKAYMFIDYAEIVFWLVVLVLGFMGVSTQCVGQVCALGIVGAVLAFVLSLCAAWLAAIATLDRRFSVKHGKERRTSSSENIQS